MMDRGRVADIIDPDSLEAKIRNRLTPVYPERSRKRMGLRQQEEGGGVPLIQSPTPPPEEKEDEE
jgi:hypothetical protein